MFSVQLMVVFSTFLGEIYAKIKTHARIIGGGELRSNLNFFLPNFWV
jgi:hypothetical protein